MLNKEIDIYIDVYGRKFHGLAPARQRHESLREIKLLQF